MFVALDNQIFALQRRGGISRYFVELIRAFADDPTLGIDVVLPWRWAPNAHAIQAGLARALPAICLGSAVTRTINAPYRRRLRRTDVYHATFYLPEYLRDAGRLPQVVTVHDMIPELLPQHTSPGVHAAKEQYVRQARVVLCVSESTRDDMHRVYGPLDADVFVTPLAADSLVFRPGLPPLPGWPSRYFLFVGKRDGYKDFSVALKGTAALMTDSSRVHLIAVGGGPLTAEERHLISRLGVRDKVRQVDLDDRELACAYANAEAFLMPSQYEGFGLPALESMAAGCPTVLARAASLPEVGGDAALYFSPGDAQGLEDILLRILDDGHLRQRLMQSGIDRAASFTWRRTAALTAHGYAQAAAQ